MPVPAVIRRATAADLEAVGRMGALLMRMHHEFDRDRFMAPEPRSERGYGSFLGSQIDKTDALVLIAEHESEVVGYLYAAIEGPSWKELRDRAGYIHDVLIEEQHRGVRIAEDLMNAAFAWMREHHVPRVVLGSAANNVRGQRFFERLGFRPTMIEMTKELD
jgi:ribosomal protein S18 acetylase RimI-like enzyme